MYSDYKAISSNSSSDDNIDPDMNQYNLFVVDDINTGNILAHKSKQDTQLNRELGIVDKKWGLNSLTTGLLKPVTEYIARLKVLHQHVNHRIKRKPSKIIREI